MLNTAEIFQSDMVLQRDKNVKIWGSADQGAEITVTIQGQRVKGVSDENGEWSVTLEPLITSENETLVVMTANESIEYQNVAVGEVWIAGGQSNMEFWMRYEKHITEERDVCENPGIRFFDVPEVAYEGQREDFDYSKVAVWRLADKENIDYFSAVGYYFEKNLLAELDVPVGIVGCNWGGTTSSAWMKESSVEKAGKPWMDEYLEKIAKQDMEHFREKQSKSPMNDRGNAMTEAFSAFVLPTTHTPEEVGAFFASMPSDVEGFFELVLPQSFSGSLYENMVKTIAGFEARGVLWYQGESDDVPGRQSLYMGMLQQLIADWRELWKEELPFFIVQLPGFESWLDSGNNDFTTLRECQQKVADQDENVFLCSISDVGEQYDIHPKDKKTVGERLFLLAMGHVYGKDILCDAPRPVDYERKGNQVIITFENVGERLQCNDEKINGLQVKCGNELVMYTFEINKERLILNVPYEFVEKELTVSFAKEKWYQVNLYNSAGIPAIPFEKTI